jgi:hypothetical protein
VDERHIYYRYTVAGEQYVGTRISFGRADRNAPDPNTLSQVTVYYNPRWPSQSVLLTGSTGILWGLIAAGLTLIGVGLAIPRVSIKPMRSAHKH